MGPVHGGCQARQFVRWAALRYSVSLCNQRHGADLGNAVDQTLIGVELAEQRGERFCIAELDDLHTPCRNLCSGLLDYVTARVNAELFSDSSWSFCRQQSATCTIRRLVGRRSTLIPGWNVRMIERVKSIS